MHITSSWTRTQAVALGFSALALGACSPKNPADSPTANPAGPATIASAPVPSSATAAQWHSAVAGVFDKVNVKKLNDKKNPEYVSDEGKTDENGVTEFFGCFDKAPPKCDARVSGKRDGFRKVQFFSEPIWNWQDTAYKYARGLGKPSVRGYISLSDCKRPKIVLQPNFRGSSWLFVEQFSVMLDGTVVLDRKFEVGEVDRENDHNSVTEMAHLTVTEEELQTLRKIDPSRQVLIRLTGKKGYAAIDAEATKTFTEGIVKLLRMYDSLDQATQKVGSVVDAACAV